MGSFARNLFICFSIFLGGFIAVWPSEALAKRVALVIGNGAYEHTGALDNPRNDAEAMAAALTEIGFEVVTAIDADQFKLRKTLAQFSERLVGADVALFYYAGHGLQVNGTNYIVPTDAELKTARGLYFQAVPMNLIINEMERVNRTNLIFLDACRDNPLSRSLKTALAKTRSAGSVAQGLAQLRTPDGTLIAYATEPGNVAADGVGSHSPFTKALLNHIKTPGQTVTRMMQRVRRQVKKETNGDQIPWDHSSLTDSFYLIPKAKKAEPAPKPSATASVDRTAEIDLAYWRSISGSKDVAVFESYLERFPKGLFVVPARHKIKILRAAALNDATLAGQTNTKARLKDTKITPIPKRKRIGVVKRKSQPKTTRVTAKRKSLPKRVQCKSGQKRNSKGQCYTPRAKTSTAKNASKPARKFQKNKTTTAREPRLSCHIYCLQHRSSIAIGETEMCRRRGKKAGKCR